MEQCQGMCMCKSSQRRLTEKNRQESREYCFFRSTDSKKTLMKLNTGPITNIFYYNNIRIGQGKLGAGANGNEE